MELGPDENLISESGASHFQDFVGVAGELVLTDKSLRFSSSISRKPNVSFSIGLSEITGVDYFKSLNICPNGIMVMLRNGSMQCFVVNNRKHWKELIQGAITKLA